MSKLTRRFAVGGAILAGILLLLVIVSILVVRTAWFRNYVRQKIIAVTEESTGGKVELGSFNFDWTHLQATMSDFVIHGSEPPGSAPLLQARKVDVRLKLFAGLTQVVDLRYLGVDTPAINIMVFPNGTTNIPSPKVAGKADNKTGLETVVDLAIYRFEILNGSLQFAQQKTSFSARGQDLRAGLDYSVATSTYSGNLAINPLFLSTGNNPPVNVKVNLPIKIGKDRIDLTNAKLETAESNVVISATLDHVADPRVSGRVNAHLSLAEMKKAADLPIFPGANGAPSFLDADIVVKSDSKTIQITNAKIQAGQSMLEAEGNLQDATNRSAMQFNGKLALDEIGKLLKLSAQPRGALQLSGTAKLNGADYQVAGNATAENVSFKQGEQTIRNVSLSSALAMDAHQIALNGIRASALGGDFTGSATLVELQRLKVNGQLRNFGIQPLGGAFLAQKIPYDGTISGPLSIDGNLKAKGLTGFSAQARLTITPGTHGVPVAGKLDANYTGANDVISIAPSFVTLPNSRLDLSGSLGNKIQVKFASTNLNDLAPAMAMGSSKPTGPLPVQLQGGTAALAADITGKLSSPRINGHITATRFAVEGRAFDSVTADVEAASTYAKIQNAVLTRKTMQAQADATVSLRNWSAGPREQLTATAKIVDGDLADLMAVAGQKDIPVSGNLNASAQINGTIGNPQGSANLKVLNGTAYEEPFDSLSAQLNLSDQLVTLSAAQFVAGAARIDASGTFSHPRDSFGSGHIQVRAASNDVGLAQFKTLQRKRPGLAGTIKLNADSSIDLLQVKGETQIAVRAVNGNFTARGLRDAKQQLGDITATAQTNGANVTYRVDSNVAGSSSQITGQTSLTDNYPTTADASVRDLNIDKILSIAGQTDLPVKGGNLTATAHVAGTLKDPRADVNFNLVKAVVYDEPIDQLQGKVNYASQRLDVPSLQISTAAGQINLSASLVHPANNFDSGHFEAHLIGDGIQLAGLRNIQKTKPGLDGIIKMNLDAAGDLTNQPGKPRVLLTKLDGNAGATGLQLNKRLYGNLTAVAQTNQNRVTFRLDSDFAKSVIHAEGEAQLGGNYPLTAKATFANLTYTNLAPFLSAEGSGIRPDFEGFLDGQLSVEGPAIQPDNLRGQLQLTRLKLLTTPRGTGGGAKAVALENQGPIVIDLDHSVFQVKNAKIAGPSTTIAVGGSISLKNDAPLHLTVNSNVNLSILQEIQRDIYSEGNVIVQATVGGQFSNPTVNGRIELKNASVNLADSPNGISNASGVILLNGNSASIQNLSGVSGGGKVTLRGYVNFAGGTLRYGVRAQTDHVRSRYAGASIVTTATAALSGTSERSVLSGTVSVEKIAFNPQSDFGSILSSSAKPAETPSAPSGPIAGMQLDVRIRTSPDVRLQTAVAQRLQADADLYLRGTLASPGLTGHVAITQGELIFFGNQYTVNRGTVNFYNQFKIQPILDIDLETQVKGVDVILGVSGPIENMKLSYRSDPPLRFEEIVALLATGKLPTSDPTIAAHQPAPPQQSFAEMGESAILGKAVAAPLANRIQRVFGVSSLTIDPTIASGSALPQARVTLQQQVTSNVTFTYSQDLSQTGSQIIRAEWALTPQLSAVATRDENGFIGLDFFVKRQFR